MSSICDTQFMIYYDELFNICEYFDLSDIINVELVSKYFSDILNDDFLWKTYYKRDYNIKHQCLHILSHKDAYKKCHNISALKQKFNMNESIIDIMNLQHLILSSKKIEEMQSIVQLVNLQTLILDNNHIKKIPKKIVQLVNLHKLHLSHNKIKKIPLEMRSLVNLRYLFLDNNRIKKIQIFKKDYRGACAETPVAYPIPHEVGLFVNLKTLDLSWNQIKKIPHEMGLLVNLEYLLLGNNQIKEIPKEITQLVKLQRLLLHENKIKIIPQMICNEFSSRGCVIRFI